MADVNVYLKYTDGILDFSNTEDGVYEPVSEQTVTGLVKRNDIVNWYAVEGIKKIKKIKRCSGAECFAGDIQYPSKKHACVGISATVDGDMVEKYDIKFEAENGYIVLVDPTIKTKNPPD